MAAMSSAMKIALGKRLLDLLGLDVDVQKMAELGMILDQLPADASPDQFLTSEEVQGKLAQAIVPKTESTPESIVIVCPHCKRSSVKYLGGDVPQIN